MRHNIAAASVVVAMSLRLGLAALLLAGLAGCVYPAHPPAYRSGPVYHGPPVVGSFGLFFSDGGKHRRRGHHHRHHRHHHRGWR
jgi:hypothetical protein